MACLLIAMFGAAGCGSAPDSDSSSAAKDSDAGVVVDVGKGQIPIEKPVKRVAMFIAGSVANYTYSAALEEGAKAGAEEAGVEIDFFEANFDITAQYNQIQNAFTSGKYQGMVVQPTTPQHCKLVTEGAVKYKVLITVVGATLCGEDDKTGDEMWSPGTLAFVGGQYAVPGQQAFLRSVIENSPGAHKAMVILGPQDFGTTKGWRVASKPLLEENPEFEVVRDVFTDWSTPDAFKKSQDALQGAPEVDVVVSTNIDLTKGAVRAIKALGREDKIRVFDVGGNQESVDLVKSGKVVSTFPSYPRSSAVTAVMSIVKASKGEEVPRFIDRDGNPEGLTKVIPADEIDEFTPEW
jgi:ribose transport system substrate-binding protein